ncbi:hemerythrin HHE cation binding domain-containing protein [Streptomyces sp. 1114.5]|uniref:hemerythrin domain-containing protein n=1 Tax=Streptomyces sp. 1114.5 TaxID=1938830 RepID=UPI000EAE5EE5|nr:hemerythrin domain-containing protein [Streptomyces sp. 1114.5]RKT12114.1 hemerythrin HHE cation binding domain-containing protein [Streptomyces sp. 1114.5]
MSTLAPIHARPDTTALLLSHTALRGEFARLAIACRAPGAEPLRAGITDHVALMLGVLRHLHEAEEDVLWPMLAAAAPYLRPELDVLEAQRAALATPVTRVRLALTSTALTSTATTGTAATSTATTGTAATSTAATGAPLDQLADPLTELAAAVRTYLAAKEEACLDAIHALLPMSAWERFEEARRWCVPPADQSRVEGVLLSYGSPEQLAHLRATTSRLRGFIAFRLTLPAHHRRMRGVYGHLAAGSSR